MNNKSKKIKNVVRYSLYLTRRRFPRSCRKFIRSFSAQIPETEFLPAALEILETPPSPAGRATSLFICLFFTLAFIWSYFGHVDIVAMAPGKIIPTGRTKIIQPLETGVVRAIHVHDGQSVKAGETLIEIDTTISAAERDRVQKELVSNQLDAASLRFSLKSFDGALLDFVAPDGASPEQIEVQKSKSINQVHEIRAKLSSLDQQITQNKANQEAVKASIKKLESSISLLKERSRLQQKLLDKQYGSKLDALAVRQEWIEHVQELNVQKARLDEAIAAISAIQQQRLHDEAEFRHKMLGDLSEVEQKIESLQEQFIQAQQKYRLQTLSAPVDGTVQQLSIHTEGGIVTPAQALLIIVPADSQLEVEAMIPNREIGFVHEGQDAKIKVDTFNFTKYGFLKGKLLSISQDAITREHQVSESDAKKTGSENETSEPKGQEFVYAARVSLEQTKIQIDERLVNLSPGMAVTVEIKTGKRRIIEYLLSPLSKSYQQSLQER